MIIGITGSIGSGKTAAAKIFSSHHFNRIDADEISHRLMKNNSEIKNKLIKNFGNEILGKNKNIDRKKLGDIAFNDNKKLKKLNSIMHPKIINEIKNQIKKIQEKCGSDAKIVIDAPLLIETNLKNYVDKIVVVKSDKRKIFVRNKNFSKDEIERILKAQMPLQEKLKYADFLVDNNKDLKHLEKEVMKMVNNLKKFQSQRN